MDLDPRNAVCQLDVLVYLDTTIALARQAFADHVTRTPASEARSSDVETYFVDALQNLWSARESLCASLEADDGQG